MAEGIPTKKFPKPTIAGADHTVNCEWSESGGFGKTPRPIISDGPQSQLKFALIAFGRVRQS